MNWTGMMQIGEKDDLVVIDKGWVEGKEIQEPKNWDPVRDLISISKPCLKQGKMSVMLRKAGKNRRKGNPVAADKGKLGPDGRTADPGIEPV